MENENNKDPMNGRRLAVLGILLIFTINLYLSFVPAVGGIAIRGAAHAPDVAKAADLTGEAENIGDLFGFWDKITATGKAVDDGSGIAKGGKGAAKGAGDITETAGGIFSYDKQKLQHGFDKHKEAFGLSGNANKENLELFKSTLEKFRAESTTLSKPGTYRGTTKGTHYYNPQTKQWIFYNNKGGYEASWLLSAEQYDNLLRKGNVQ